MNDIAACAIRLHVPVSGKGDGYLVRRIKEEFLAVVGELDTTNAGSERQELRFESAVVIYEIAVSALVIDGDPFFVVDGDLWCGEAGNMRDSCRKGFRIEFPSTECRAEDGIRAGFDGVDASSGEIICPDPLAKDPDPFRGAALFRNDTEQSSLGEGEKGAVVRRIPSGVAEFRERSFCAPVDCLIGSEIDNVDDSRAVGIAERDEEFVSVGGPFDIFRTFPVEGNILARKHFRRFKRGAVEDEDSGHVVIFCRDSEASFSRGEECFQEAARKKIGSFIGFAGEDDIPKFRGNAASDRDFLLPSSVTGCFDSNMVVSGSESGQVECPVHVRYAAVREGFAVDEYVHVARIGLDRDGAGVDENAPFEAEPVAESEEEDRARRRDKTDEEDPEESIVDVVESHIRASVYHTGFRRCRCF